MIDNILSYFVPPQVKAQGRASEELARTFVFTHLFGPVIASPMGLYLIAVSPEINWQLMLVIGSIMSFSTLAPLLKWSGNLELCALLSFQTLVGAAFFGTFHYGGVSSPFLPWLIVSLLLGFFYLSKRPIMVIALFAASFAIFLTFVWFKGFSNIIPPEDLRPMGWLSIVAATVYMSWMALYYARMIAMRSELESEADRYRSALDELETARQLAETMNRSKTRFFAKMSHELRTPLNAIIGYSDLLMEDTSETAGDGSQKVKDISRINSAGKHLLSLVSDVLDVSSLERDANRMDVGEFSLQKLCDEVLASVGPMVEANGNSLIVHCDDTQITSDERKLRQVLINLLSNAAKFTKNGTVTLSAAATHRMDGHRLVISVADTGMGIAPNVLPKLFKSYIQADETISERFGGTGLGLSLCRKFSVMLGGEIDATSKLGKGTTFTVDVPAVLPVDMTVPFKTEEKPQAQPQAAFATA